MNGLLCPKADNCAKISSTPHFVKIKESGHHIATIRTETGANMRSYVFITSKLHSKNVTA